jgi:integrase
LAINVQPDHQVIPSERRGFSGHQSHLTGAVAVYDFEATQSMSSMKSAWTACRKAAGVWCRLHDFRHTFISALGEAGIPDSTTKSLAGWMSVKMPERYSHTRNQAKRDAVSKPPTKG